ncbi:MAG: hypothetical protein WAQ28_16865 [Bacteroidia bacterium]|jgi:hypothetical protein
MKIRAVLLFVLLLGLSSHVTFAFDKKDFYKVLASNALTEIESQFDAVKTLSLPERDAYEGALMMKKAGLQKDKKAQLKLFKEGKGKLEGAINKEPENCEFRLLRLIIQENAPSALGYNKQIEQDCTFIGENYKSAPSVLKTIIRDYSKQSQKLKLPA